MNIVVIQAGVLFDFSYHECCLEYTHIHSYARFLLKYSLN